MIQPRAFLNQIEAYVEQNQANLLRYGVAAAALLASALLAARASQARNLALLLRDPLLLIFPALGMGLALLRWPHLGLAGLVFASMAVPLDIGTGTQSTINITVILLGLLLGLWLLRMIAGERAVRLLPSRTFVPLIVFCIIAVLAFLVGQLSWFSFVERASLNAQVAGLAVFILSAGAYLLAANEIKGIRWLQILVWLFLALSALHIVGQIIPPLEPFTSRFIMRGVTKGSSFWLWTGVLAFSQGMFNHRLRRTWRGVLLAIFLGAVYFTMFHLSDWVSGWLPMVVGVAVVLWVSRSPLKWAATLIGAVLVLTQFYDIQNTVYSQNEYSFVTRLEAWRIVAEIVKASPIFGLGPANYRMYTPLYSILGYNVQFNSHNNYVDLVAQTGLLGLAAFFWFAWEVGRLGWRLRARAAPGFQQAYVYGALGGLVGMLAAGMLGDWFLPFVYNVSLNGFRGSVLGWLFLGGLAALEQFIPRTEAK